MSNPKFTTSLDKALTLLDKKAWADPLIELEQKFQLIPNDATAFGDELLHMLWTLIDAHKIDPDLPIKNLLAIRLSKFDAWTYRFIKVTKPPKHYLNPLENDVSEFIHAAVSHSGTAFPAEDIIKRWVRDYLI